MILGGKESGQSVTEKVAEYIIGHVSNSSLENPIIKIDPIFGIDMSVTKHVLMLWIVAIIVSLCVIIPIRKHTRQKNILDKKTLTLLLHLVQLKLLFSTSATQLLLLM